MKRNNTWNNEYEHYVEQNKKEETLGIIAVIICAIIFLGPFIFGTLILILAHFGLIF